MARSQVDQFAKGVHLFGGQSFLFRQKQYHETFTYSDEQVRDANKDGAIEEFGGYCWALCIVFIQQRGNFFNFASFITSAGGRGMVRGYQAMQHNKKLKGFHRWRTNVDLGKILLHGVVESKGRSETLEFNDSGMTPLGNFLAQRQQHYIVFSMNQSKNAAREYGKHSGHAICLVHTADQIAVFDPNRGLGLFNKTSDQSPYNFCRFLKEMVRILYKDRGYDRFRAVAYQSQQGDIELI